MSICFSQLLSYHKVEADVFRAVIVSSNETWVHDFEPESKQSSMKC